MKFFKGVLKKGLKDNYIPGTVTTNFREALMWQERISSKKSKGPSKHIQHGEAVIIEIEYEGVLLSHEEFQRPGVMEHHRKNCWTSSVKDKAQINSVCQYRILTIEERVVVEHSAFISENEMIFFYSDDYCFGRNIPEYKMMEFTPSAVYLPLTVPARKGLESGLIFSLEEYEFIFHKKDKRIESIDDLVDVLNKVN